MAEPEAIVEVILEQLRAVRSAPRKSQDFASPGAELHGRHIVVTAGPTVEDFDPVRFIGNRSTGKMGFALAAVARERGARVTLISGPVSLPTPAGVTRIDVRGALELQARLDEVLGARLDGADAVIMAAAVADYRPAQVATDKLKKSTDTLTLELVKNPDVIAEVGRRRASTRPVLVAFAVETRDLLENARHKRRNKQVDLVVANTAQDGFGGDHNEVVVVGAEGEPTLRGSKRAVAERILDLVRDRMPAAAST